MIFKRTYRYQSSVPVEAIKTKLLGKHVNIHNMDFEVYEKDKMLRIIPHAEQERALKTLPITHIEFRDKGGAKTQVVISSKMRKIDSGGPLLVVVFCAFMLIAAIILLMTSQETQITYILLSISLLIFLVFWLRMQTGYFDYVRKIRDYVKATGLN
jgi:hypothetical protein